MPISPQATLATAAARAQRLENEVAGVLQSTVGTCLNSVFFTERLTALQGVHRRQLLRLNDVFSPVSPS